MTKNVTEIQNVDAKKYHRYVEAAKNGEIKVNYNPELFYIASLTKGWLAAAGHRCTVQNMDIAVVPNDKTLEFVHVISGVTLGRAPLAPIVMKAMDTQLGFVKFIETEIAPGLFQFLDMMDKQAYNDELKGHLQEMEQLHGELPEVVEITE